MYFINETGCAADILRSEHRGDQLANSLLVRVKYRIDGEKLVCMEPSEQPSDIRRGRVELGDYGILPPDRFHPPAGTDIIILGDAVAREESTEAMRVVVSIGPYRVLIDVFGDRIWETATRVSPAKKFARIPVTYKNAFGGVAKGPYGDLPWQHNPVGKGFAFTRDEVVGKELPNIEVPGHHVKLWDDRPNPIGLGPYPTSWGLKLMKMVAFDPERKKVDFRPDEGMFNVAHPALSGQRVNSGPVHIAGMSKTGAVDFVLPPCPFETIISLGEREYVRELDLQEIIIDVRSECGDRPTVELLYRKMFRYVFTPLTRRITVVRRKASAL